MTFLAVQVQLLQQGELADASGHHAERSLRVVLSKGISRSTGRKCRHSLTARRKLSRPRVIPFYSMPIRSYCCSKLTLLRLLALFGSRLAKTIPIRLKMLQSTSSSEPDGCGANNIQRARPKQKQITKTVDTNIHVVLLNKRGLAKIDQPGARLKKERDAERGGRRARKRERGERKRKQGERESE
eukprot:4006309-Pleurochrysis_carterae.AAC.1